MSRYSDVILADNPVAYYRLNDSWGTPGSVGLGNPGFENQANATAVGWIGGIVGTGTVNTADTSNPHSGTYNAKLTNPSTGNYGAMWGGAGTQVETATGVTAINGTITGIPTNGSKQVTISFWAKGSGSGTVGPCRLEFSNSPSYTNQPSANPGTVGVDNNFAVTTSYQKFTFTVNVPAGYEYLYIEMYSNGTGTSTSVYIDDIFLSWQTNVAGDPSFESGTLTALQTFWYLTGPSEMSIDTTNFVTGSQSILQTTTRTSAGWNPIQILSPITLNGFNNLIPALGGQQYFCSMWYKMNGGARGNHAKVEWFDASGNFIVASFWQGGVDGLHPWTYVNVVIQAPPNASYGRFNLMGGFWDGVTGSNAQIWYDDIHFELYSMVHESRGNGPDGILISPTQSQASGATSDGDGAITFQGINVYSNFAPVNDDFETVGPSVQTLWHSLGTEGGTDDSLNYWIQDVGSWSLSSHVASCTATSGARIRGGHPDLWDCTFTVRFQMPSTTNAHPGIKVHCDSGGNGVQCRIDQFGTLHLDKTVAGVFTSDLATASTTITQGNFYWLRLQASGTTYTATIYADSGPGSIGSQLATCNATISDASIQSGQVALQSANAASIINYGGAFSNVCTVTGPSPKNTATGLQWIPNQGSGEVAFCWSKNNPHGSTYSLSLYSPPGVSNSQGWWNLASIPTVSGLNYAISTYARATVGSVPTNFYPILNFNVNSVNAPVDGNWHFFALPNYGCGANAGIELVGYGPGTFYFDDIQVYQMGGSVLFPDSPLYRFTGLSPFSVEFWAFSNGQALNGFPRLVTKEHLSPSRNGWLIYTNEGGSGQYIGFERWSVGSSSSAPITPAGSFPYNTWTYIVAVFDGSTMKIYINGNLSTSGIANLPVVSNTDPMGLGYIAAAPQAQFFGAVDELALYGYALTQQQITTHLAAASTSFAGVFGGNILTTSSSLFTLPNHCDIAVTETLPFNVNIGNYVQTTDALTNITTTLFNVSGVQVTSSWVGTVSVANGVITIPLNGNALQLGQTYLMLVTLNFGTYKKTSFFTYIHVVA